MEYLLHKIDILEKHKAKKHQNRGELIEELLDSQSHQVIWIDSWHDYRDIEKKLKSLDYTKPHVLIYQTEEDWFHYLDFTETRIKIKNNARWTDQSFIITNSQEDKIQTNRLGIKSKCSPGLLDLISYYPYDLGCLENSISQIKYHTGFCVKSFHPDRLRLKEFLDKHQGSVCFSIMGIDQVLPEEYQLPEFSNAPFIPVTADAWMKQTAFGVVIETLHRKSALGFASAPTLSEKTYKNMHFQMPAVICGGQNTREYLKNLGFDTWDWLVDWEFDREPDDDIRFDKFLLEVKRLLDTPLHRVVKIIKDNQDSLLHNRDRLFWLVNNHDLVDL
jgi:hypothetical protein